MSVVLDVRFWHDGGDSSAVEQFLQMLEAVSTWPQVVGGWKRLEIVETRPTHLVFEKSGRFSLDEIRDIVLAYRDDELLRFNADILFQCWRSIQELPPSRGELQLWVRSWGGKYANLEWLGRNERLQGRSALALPTTSLYHAWPNYEPTEARDADLVNQAVGENLADLTDLLKRVIEATKPSAVKIFKDTVDNYYAVQANLVYYCDLAEMVQEVRFLHEEGELGPRALLVTEETVQLVLDAGDWPIIPVSAGVMALSHQYFMNASMRDFFHMLLEMAEDPAQGIRTAGEDVAEVIASFARLSKDANSRDVDKVMPVFERHREEALAQLGGLFDGPRPTRVQWMAAYALGALGGDGAAKALIGVAEGMRECAKEVRQQVVKSLGQLQDTRSADMLVKTLADSDREVRAEAVRSLGAVNPKVLLAHIEMVLNDGETWVRLAGLQFLEGLGDADVVAGLIEHDTVERDKLACLLGRMKDPRAIEPLLEILNGDKATKYNSNEVKEAANLLVQFQDPRVVPALVTILQGKQKLGGGGEAAEQALLDLKARVGSVERETIEEAIVALEEEHERNLCALHETEGKPEPAFTFETYKAFIDEVNVLRRKHDSATVGRNFEMVRELTREIMIELPLSYRARLPKYTLALCPICGGRVTETIDTFSLSGAGWWISEPRGFGWFGRRLQMVYETLYPLAYKRFTKPSYEAECVHAQAVHYGVNLNGVIPDDVKQARYVVIGSERPGVLRPFMEREESCVVVHALPVGRLDGEEWQPRYTAYFVTYFSQDVGAFQQSLLPKKWYDEKFLWPYEWMDYDLKAWVAVGKVHWMAQEVKEPHLQSEPIEAFPYGDVEGLIGRWAVNLSKGASLLPPIQGVDLYNPMQRGFRAVETEEKEALQRRNLRHLRR